jgi:hypothetical protein
MKINLKIQDLTVLLATYLIVAKTDFEWWQITLSLLSIMGYFNLNVKERVKLLKKWLKSKL